MANDPLAARLFGYGVPYQVHIDAEGVVQPLPTEPAREAEDLAGELAQLAGLQGPTASPTPPAEQIWAVSVPFGRCGVEGLPREHLAIYNVAEGYLDTLTAEGYTEQPIDEGQILTVVPGMVIRLRARPRDGHRVLVRFQTEDRTPLLGNASPFVHDNVVPEAFDLRLKKTHTAFAEMVELHQEDSALYQARLARFFTTMAERIAGNNEIEETQIKARQQGAYDVADEEVSGLRQQALLNAEVIARIRHQDEKLFRFPGMFGGITTLFNILE
jgi:hypothetical protein